MGYINKTKTMNIKPGKISYKILKWMQEHEISLKNTTARHIASRVAALPDVENGELTIEQAFGKMVQCNIIYRDHHERSLLSDYRINYWHKSIPADILADAPLDVKRAMAKTIDDMEDNQYMDEEGAVVTPNAVEKCEDPFNEDGEFEETDLSKHATEIANLHAIKVTDTSPQFEEEPTTQEVSVPVEVKKDGKTMSITVNLTINL